MGESVVCKICLDNDGILVKTPCKCSGHSGYIHEQCMEELLNFEGGQKFSRVCRECGSEYDHRQVRTYLHPPDYHVLVLMLCLCVFQLSSSVWFVSYWFDVVDSWLITFLITTTSFNLFVYSFMLHMICTLPQHRLRYWIQPKFRGVIAVMSDCAIRLSISNLSYVLGLKIVTTVCTLIRDRPSIGCIPCILTFCNMLCYVKMMIRVWPRIYRLRARSRPNNQGRGV